MEGAASDRSDGGFGHEFILYIVPDPQTLVEPVHKREGEAAGQHPVDKDRRQHADAGVQNTVHGVGDISVRGGVEQQDAQHHAAGLYAAHPDTLAQQDQNDHADEGQGDQDPGVAAVREQLHVNGKQPHADKTAYHCAEEAVAAVETALHKAAAHAENGADAGEGGVAVQKVVDQRAQGCRKGGLDVAHTDFRKQASCFFMVFHGVFLRSESFRGG